jgi:hypothetical protein
MNYHHRSSPAIAIAAQTFAAAFILACADPAGPAPTLSTAIAHPGLSREAKGGNGGGSTSAGANVLLGDFALVDGDAPALGSTCPSNGFAGNGWAVVFGHTECLIVTPLWASGTYDPYPLRDDVTLNVRLEKGKNGRITHVRLYGQDVIGEDGIAHETDWLAVAVPVVPNKAGFTLHVHAKNVAVWRLDSHLSGGNRVDMIGTVSIGDVVYPAR